MEFLLLGRKSLEEGGCSWYEGFRWDDHFSISVSILPPRVQLGRLLIQVGMLAESINVNQPLVVVSCWRLPSPKVKSMPELV